MSRKLLYTYPSDRKKLTALIISGVFLLSMYIGGNAYISKKYTNFEGFRNMTVGEVMQEMNNLDALAWFASPIPVFWWIATIVYIWTYRERTVEHVEVWRETKCQRCGYSGKCLYENTEFAGLKASDCCDLEGD